jgi:hypothetical protein
MAYASGRLYVADTGGERVAVLGVDLELLAELRHDEMKEPRDVSVTPHGAVVVAAEARLLLFAPGGALLRMMRGECDVPRPVCVAFVSGGELIAGCAGDALCVWNLGGDLHSRCSDWAARRPTCRDSASTAAACC